MEEEYEYANELVKRVKNPKRYQKIHLRFTHAIEKDNYIDPHTMRANLTILFKCEDNGEWILQMANSRKEKH